MTVLDERVRAAQGDAWQAEGRLRAPFGGGVLELPGVRLMASGLPFPQWNSGDVTEVELFPLNATRAWYAARGDGRGVPWGVRVPAEQPIPYGRHLFRKRCMALRPEHYRAPRVPNGIDIRAASARDADAVARIDAAAFEAGVDDCRAWNTPHLGASGFSVVLAEIDGEPIGCATSVFTNDRAGPCIGIFGVAVLEAARRRGAGTALTKCLVDQGWSRGARLAHLNPDTETAAALYERLGFRETAGFDVYVDL